MMYTWNLIQRWEFDVGIWDKKEKSEMKEQKKKKKNAIFTGKFVSSKCVEPFISVSTIRPNCPSWSCMHFSDRYI